jgi:hypothetical protein
MRLGVAVALLMLFSTFSASASASATNTRALVSGKTVVIFGESVWNRSEGVISGVEAALRALPGVTVLVPRSRPSSLRDAELQGVDTVVEIFAAEVTSREDRYQSLYLGGVSVSGTLTEIRVRLGLRFLRVTGNSSYLELLGSREAEGFASGLTSISAYTAYTSYGVTSYQNLEAAAFRSAAASILGR